MANELEAREAGRELTGTSSEVSSAQFEFTRTTERFQNILKCHGTWIVPKWSASTSRPKKKVKIVEI